MLNLKSAYFYFLAIKISLKKITKRIYFKSKYYNESLKSTPPKQFYFLPNPFLLSSLTSYKNFTFKIHNYDKNYFWAKQKSIREEKNLHNFLWLNLIDRKNDGSIIRKIITDWIHFNKNYNSLIWEDSVISKRIISWLLNADIILSTTNNAFKKDFLSSIISQTNHLKRNYKFEKNKVQQIENLTAILLTGLVFKEYKINFEFGIKELKNITEILFDDNGFPVTRNPNDLLKITKLLILIKECAKDAQEYLPDFLDIITDKSLNCLKHISTPNYRLPLFNGSKETDLEEYNKYLLNLNIKTKNLKSNVGGIQILKYKKDSVFFDIGNPPKKNFSSTYQSGPLSFEYFNENEKIITNCGFGSEISKKAALLSRFTSAQSSLCINDTSVVRFERNKLLNSAFGNSLKDSFQISNAEFINNDDEIYARATHDAYLKLFGFLHSRNIKINKRDESLIGCDELIKKKHINLIKFSIRFHLYPGINAVQTIGKSSVLIQIKKNKSLLFSSKNNNIIVEKSIFLGGNKILNNLCINISGKLEESKAINWEIKKKI